MNQSPKLRRRRLRRIAAALSCGLSLVLPCAGWQAPEDASRGAAANSAAGHSEPSAGTGPATGGATHSRRRLNDLAVEADNWTFRPTVVIRRGTSQGSGTIIASLDGETLVLTAAHVIRSQGPISVELHRYNLGMEHHSSAGGNWPKHVAAEQAVTDPQADLAILRVRKMVGLPFVAKLGPEGEDVPGESVLTSVGIDLGSKLSSWRTRLTEVLWFELNESGSDRPFLITDQIPEHGRSGGGLYDKKGRIVGVCVGHAELVKGRRMGVFSSVENVRRLLREHDLITVVDQSEARLARLSRMSATVRRPSRSSRSAVTPTHAPAQAADRRP